MRRLYISLLCLLFCVAPASFARAEQPGKLSREALESVRSLNLHLPSEFPDTPDIYQQAEPVVPPQVIAPWPTIDWSVSTPEEQGMKSGLLNAAFLYAVRNDSKAVVVIRNGYIVGEWYAEGWNETTRQSGFSMAKSFSSALVGMLIDDGYITSVDQPVADYVSEWDDFRHGKVTVRNLLSMNSGLYWDAVSDTVILATRYDQSAFAVGLPIEASPGRTWVYNNSAVQVISELILQAAGMPAEDYARERLWNKIGMWNATWLKDKAGNTLTYQSVIASAREFAKFGYLYLRGGMWDGEQIVPAEWVAESTRFSQLLNPVYGYLWWLNTAGLWWPNVPADAFAASGLNEKKIYVVPSLDIVAVRLGSAQPTWDDNAFLGLICASVEQQPILEE